MRDKYAELAGDIDNVFGKGNCSPSGMKEDIFLLITTTGKDGFDDKHFFKLSGAVYEILDGVPQIKVALDRSNEADFQQAKDGKASFEYERLDVMTNGDTKILVGNGGVERGKSMSRYTPNYVQPTVKFLRTVKTKWKM